LFLLYISAVYTDQADHLFLKKGWSSMKNSRYGLIIFFIFSAILSRVHAGNFSTGLLLGYRGGVGVQVNGMVSGFAIRRLTVILNLWADMIPYTALMVKI